MLVYGPDPDAEFVPILGGLTHEEFGLFDDPLAAVVPAVRYLKELDECIHATVQRFTLKLHRDDRERALQAIHEVMERISSVFSGIEEEDNQLAALLSQLARAWDANDQIAAQLMKRYLRKCLEGMLNWLLVRSKIDWAVDLWLDGISAQELQFVQPNGLAIQGYIYVGRKSDGDSSQWREPFEAELRSSTHGPSLESFLARFGDRSRLTSCVPHGDIAEDYPIHDSAYTVRTGSAVRRTGDDLVEWAFEFRKG